MEPNPVSVTPPTFTLNKVENPIKEFPEITWCELLDTRVGGPLACNHNFKLMDCQTSGGKFHICLKYTNDSIIEYVHILL